MQNALSHSICGEELWLLPDKAVYWVSRKMLILADLHLGKSLHFQKSGFPVSSQVSQKDFVRLSLLLDTYPAERLLVLGDLFHSRENGDWDRFGEWLHSTGLVLELVKGNHDILPQDLYEKYGILIHQSTMTLAPFFFVHTPPEEKRIPKGLYALSGHVHPAVHLSGKARQGLKLECFCFDKRQGILPAFGSFTGNEMVDKNDFEKVFVIAGTSVIELPAQNPR